VDKRYTGVSGNTICGPAVRCGLAPSLPEAAGGLDDVAGNPSGFGRDQEGDNGSDIAAEADTAQPRSSEKGRIDLFGMCHLPISLGIDQAREHGIDQTSSRPQLRGEAPGDHIHSALACTVDGRTRRRVDRCDGADVDDGADVTVRSGSPWRAAADLCSEFLSLPRAGRVVDAYGSAIGGEFPVRSQLCRCVAISLAPSSGFEMLPSCRGSIVGEFSVRERSKDGCLLIMS